MAVDLTSDSLSAQMRISKLLKGKVKLSKEKMPALAVVEYFIRYEEYNVLKIDIVLFDYGLEPLSNIVGR